MSIKKERMESIFKVEKTKELRMGDDATVMTFCACLKKEFNIKDGEENLDLNGRQISEVFMNTFIVQCIQISFISAIWIYAI